MRFMRKFKKIYDFPVYDIMYFGGRLGSSGILLYTLPNMPPML